MLMPVERLPDKSRWLWSPATLRATIAREICALCGLRLGHLRQSDRRTRGVRGRDYSTTAGPILISAARLSARGPLVRWLRTNDAPLIWSRASEVISYLPIDERCFLEDLNAVVCLPLVSRGALLGIVVLTDSTGTWHPPAEVIGVVADCARRAAEACEAVTNHDAERAKQEIAARAQQLAIAGRLAESMAHEVRNPLTAISSTVQHLIDIDDLPNAPDRRKLMSDVLIEVGRVNHAVSKLLGLSRLQGVTFATLDLTNEIEHALKFLAAHCAHRGVTLSAQSERALPIYGDSHELQQVLLNLLLNASDATPAGGSICVTASSSRNDDGEDLARVSIADTGTGMSADTLANVFDPFFTTKAEGTGLGLPISVDIVKRHSGRLTIDSEVGRGTTVHLTFPLRVGE